MALLLVLYIMWLLLLFRNIDSYVVIDLALTWSDAEQYCSQHCDSDLASMHSQQDFDMILNISVQYWNNGGIQNDIHIGLYYNSTDYWWSWIDGSSFAYGNTLYKDPWRGNEPNNYLFDTQHCVAILNGVYKWGSVYCSDENPFICNGDCTSTSTTNTSTINIDTTITSTSTDEPTSTPIAISTRYTSKPTSISINSSSTTALIDTAAPLVITASFICLIISILLLYDFLSSIKWHQWETKRIKYLGGFCILSYVLSLLFAASSHTVYVVHSSLDAFIGLYELQLFFWGIAKCLTYIIFIARLHYLFENTAYQSQRFVIRTLYVSIGVFFILHIQFMAVAAAYYDNKISNHAFIIFRDIQVVINDFVDGIISITLFYLFMSKLYKISQNIHLNNMYNQNALTSVDKTGEYNTIFFNSTVRLTVLSLLPVIATLINFILETVLAFNSKAYMRGYGYNIWLWSSTSIYLYLFDSMSCIVCIYMTFSIENAKLMYSKCCKSCDKICRSLAHIRHQNSTQMINVTDNYFELTDDELSYSVA